MADEGIQTKISVLGDKEYKAAMSDISRQLNVLNSDMRASQSAFMGQEDTLAGLQDKHEKLSKVYETQAKKVELISAQLAKAEQDYGANSKQADQLRITLNNATTQMNNTKAKLEDTDDALGKMEKAVAGADDESAKYTLTLKDVEKAEGDTGKEMDDTTSKAEKHKETMKKVGDALKTGFVEATKATCTALAAVGAAAVAAAKECLDFAQGAGTYADNLLTLSQQTGVSTQTLQEWTYASNFIDTSLETMTGSMARMTKTMGEASNGSKTAQEKFAALGVSITDSNGNFRDSEEVFMDCIDALGKVQNETERDALAMALFGKSAQDLNPLIEAGSAAFKEIGQEAKDMGVVFSDDAVVAMGSFDDSMQRVKASGEGLKNSIGLTVMPMFQPLMDTAAQTMAGVSNALQDGLQPGELDTLISDLVAKFDSTVTQISGVLDTMLPIATEAVSTVVSAVVEKLPTLLDTLLPAAQGLLQNLLDAIVQNVGPITGMAVDLVTSITGFITENAATVAGAAIDIITGLVDGIGQALPDLIPAAVDMIGKITVTLTDHLPEIVTAGVDLIVNLVKGLGDAIPKIVEKMPEIVSSILTALKEIDWIGLGTDLITGLVNGLSNAVTSLLQSIKDVFVRIWDGVKEVFGIHSPSTEAASVGGFILDGLVNGFLSAVDAVITKVKEIFGRIWDAIKSIFGFGSKESEESKEAKTAGRDIMEGMQKGITENEDDLKNTVRKVAQTALDTLKKELGADKDENSKTKDYGKSVLTGIVKGLEGAQESDFRTGANAAMKAVESAVTTAFGVGKTGFLGLGGTGAQKFEDIGKAVCKSIADGINANDNNVDTVRTAITGVANAAYERAVTDMASGITGSSDTVNAAVKNVADSANNAAQEVLSRSAGADIAEDWTTGLKKGIETKRTAIVTAVRTIASAAQAQGVSLLTSAKGSSIGASFGGGIASGISGKAGAARSAARSLASNAIDALWDAVGGQNVTKFQEIGDAMANGMVRGLNQGSAKIIREARLAAQKAYLAAKQELQIASPSRKMAEIGQYFDEGFAQGIEKSMDTVLKASRGLASRAESEAVTSPQTGAGSQLDYDRIGAAVARANRQAGLGNTVISVDGRVLGQTLEPSVSRASYNRMTSTAAGRASRLAVI